MRLLRPFLFLAATLAALAARPPNILFVLTDDQGSSSLSCYGGTHVATPHLDSLARDGVRFTAAYVMPQCTPTRAALLSGQHTARNGMWHVIPWYGLPWAPVAEPMFREQFPRDAFNLAKGLRAAGYATGIFGKWHLTTGPDGDYAALKPAAGPTYGFDYVAPRGPGTQNDGNWKLIEHFGDSFDAAQRYRPGRKLELFNLRADLGETDDRAAAEPERASAMSARLHAWIKSIPAEIPGPNPHTDRAKRFNESRVKQLWNR